MRVLSGICVSLAMLLSIGCTNVNPSVAPLRLSSLRTIHVAKPIDILWVIDNSSSMETSQNVLSENLTSFISPFLTKGYDFQIGVVSTDAWEKRFNSGSTKARLRDGIGGNRSGVYIMSPATTDLSTVFSTNIRLGTAGNGDERAFESFRQGLLEPSNVNFRRPDAFLAVIIVSDEEDFSQSVSNFNESYSNSNLLPITYYQEFLDTFTDRQAGEPFNYSVSSITTLDSVCISALSGDGFQRKLAPRVMELSLLTGGEVRSLCSNMADNLAEISEAILSAANVYRLDQEPIEWSIRVRVDNYLVPEDTLNGWSYDPTIRSIRFNGSAIPVANANIQISFIPAIL